MKFDKIELRARNSLHHFSLPPIGSDWWFKIEWEEKLKDSGLRMMKNGLRSVKVEVGSKNEKVVDQVFLKSNSLVIREPKIKKRAGDFFWATRSIEMRHNGWEEREMRSSHRRKQIERHGSLGN